jgi:hypothetical protein
MTPCGQLRDEAVPSRPLDSRRASGLHEPRAPQRLAQPAAHELPVGKTFYRSSWLTDVVDEHWDPRVPHPVVRRRALGDQPDAAVHHYMVQDEEQFVQKVARLIAGPATGGSDRGPGC